MTHPTNNPNEDNRTEYQKYYDAVETCVDVIENRLEEGGELSELVWQELDSSEYIMYYSKNMVVLQESTNDPGEWKHLVSDSDSWQDVIQALAYSTMEQDLWDEIRDRDLEQY